MKERITNRLVWGGVFEHGYTARELGIGGFVGDIKKAFGLKFGLFGLQESVDVQKRRDRFWLVKRKMDIGIRATRIVRWVPFVRAVFLCNTVAFGWPKSESDVDVCVVVKSGRIWIARLLVTFLLEVSGLRRSKKRVANKICLSFYVADSSLDFSGIAIEDDVYLAYWIDSLVPLYDPECVLGMCKKRNQWAQKWVGSFSEFLLSATYRVEDRGIQKKIKHMFERAWGGSYGNLIEGQAKEVQKSKMARNSKSIQRANDSRVVISDDMLKFHENDRREDYREKWKELRK